jgi:hypothetical protein
MTPSDNDWFLDAGGHVLFVEMSSSANTWLSVPRGQGRGYAAIIEGSRRHCAALCRHNVPLSEGRLISSREDVVSFQLMLDFDFGGLRFSRVFVGNESWDRFVLRWCTDPIRTRRLLLPHIDWKA